MVARFRMRGHTIGWGRSIAVTAAHRTLGAVLAAAIAATTASAVAREDSTNRSTQRPGAGSFFVSEIIDSTYFVGPAEFFALDLPASARGAAAIHVFGEVSVVGSGKRDIIVRLFRASDYQSWLKRRGGTEAKALWSSQRSRTVKLDQDIPAGAPVVLLLDNGYSIRTPKRVRVQIQLHFQEGAGVSGEPASETAPPPATEAEEGEIVPRGNAEEDVPPPPPPPDEGTN
ncbi:MAG: hypothetical protein ACREDF_11245 [Thermoplasmata archaeon]